MSLDDAYANAAYIEGAAAYPEKWTELAHDFRAIEASIGRARLNISYGPKDRQLFDLFLPSARPKGLLVFIHGGYWKSFDKTYWSHLAHGPGAHDWAVAMVGYTLAPEVTVPEITTEISQAIDAAAEKVAGPIRLAGHSAGGHLVARMAMKDAAPKSAGRIEKITSISPVGDLRPLLETEMKEQLRLTPDAALKESPTLSAKSTTADVHVWVGADERPVFLEQAQNLAQAWDCGLTVHPGRHHFNVIEDLADPNSPLTKAVLS